MKRVSAVVVLAGLSLACLNGENRHAFYLEPDGAATWSVTQEDVRPDSGGLDRKDDAEREYLARARQGDLEIARALRGLGASWVETRIVRDRPPFTIVTEAEFKSAAWMIEEFLTRVGFEAEAQLHFEGDRTRLSFAFREVEAEATDEDPEQAEMCLLESTEAYRFVLTEGEFLEAAGFRLDESRTTAFMLDPDEVEPDTDRPGASYSLTWSSAGQPGR